MRFTENGPSIPDELLYARDEGRVVFFCGAGLSQSRANLPSFFELSKKVLVNLGVTDESSANKLLKASLEIEEKTGISGLVSADRIFSLLEDEFEKEEIEKAVADELKIAGDADTRSHDILIRLARTDTGKIKIVTTNFDRLFDSCDSNIKKYDYPQIPDSNHIDNLNGVVYLHGRLNEAQSGALPPGFILSSSSFGEAYLSDGWATKFFKDIVNKYYVVFVGYTAEDPPVRYLLEALRQSNGYYNKIYAFQSGGQREAKDKWRNKGVEAISYDPAGGHRVLWETLEKWAERADDPEKWRKDVLGASLSGPEAVEPHIRGQVAHIVSDLNGARELCRHDPVVPPEWICVFDPTVRYGTPGYFGSMFEVGEYIDPFDIYCIDSDDEPEREQENTGSYIGPEREVPGGAWSAFDLTLKDKANIRTENISKLFYFNEDNIPSLPARLSYIGRWISNVAPSPELIWWFSRNSPTHKSLRFFIQNSVARNHRNNGGVILQAWEYLLESWRNKENTEAFEGHKILESIEMEGFTYFIFRRIEKYLSPKVCVRGLSRSHPIPPKNEAVNHVRDLLFLDITFPSFHSQVEVPEEWLGQYVSSIRRCLENACELEIEISGSDYSHLPPITPQTPKRGSFSGRYDGVSGLLLEYADRFQSLSKVSVVDAQNELQKWQKNVYLFNRLRIWSGKIDGLREKEEVGEFLVNVDGSTFWDEGHNRDLLLTMAELWPCFSDSMKWRLEEKILEGPKKYPHESDEGYKRRLATKIGERYFWLLSQGCEMRREPIKVEEELNSIDEAWEKEGYKTAADSHEPRGGFVKVDDDCSDLLNEPADSLVEAAEKLKRRTDDFLEEKDPFLGLVKNRPLKAISALRKESKKGNYVSWAWRTFLGSEARESDDPRLFLLAAKTLLRHPKPFIAEILYYVCTWVLNVSDRVSEIYSETFRETLRFLISVMRENPELSGSAIAKRTGRSDWVSEALNSPSGKLARAMLNDSRKANRGGEFDSEWLSMAQDILSLPGDLHRNSLVIFNHNIDWFYAKDAKWTKLNIIKFIDGKNNQDVEAFWDGLLWGSRVPQPELYLYLKPYMLKLAKSDLYSESRKANIVSGILLAGWNTKMEEFDEKFVSNEELRAILLNCSENFRVSFLEQIWRFVGNLESERKARLKSVLPEMFEKVWPKQKTIKSDSITQWFLRILFVDEDVFEENYHNVWPFLAKTSASRLQDFLESGDGNLIVQKRPYEVLSIIDKVLPDEPLDLPFWVGDVLENLVSASPEIKHEESYIKIKRKWNSR